jgi:hypothetical protein
MKTLLTPFLALALLVGVAEAQTRTPRHSLDFPGDEAGNRTMRKIDSVLPKARIHRKLITCGDGASSATHYQGPHIAAFRGLAPDLSIDGTVCDALDSGTEATADLPLPDGTPGFFVLGATCCVDADPAADVVFTLRSAAADLSPTMTCTVGLTGTDQCCHIRPGGSAPFVAAGATVANKVVTGEDLSTTGVGCTWDIEFN